MSTDETENIITTTDNQTVINEEDIINTTHSPSCPCCGSDKVYGISRVVGYFSIIDNWNNSKRAELKRRQAGDYWDKELG